MTTAPAPRSPLHIHKPLWIGAAAFLAVPAAAMLVTREMNWGPEDFAALGLMLLVLCLAVELSWHFFDTVAKRLIAAGIGIFLFLAVWAELAVGLFD